MSAQARHIKWGLISELLMRAFSWCPCIPGTLKLDSNLYLFKCAYARGVKQGLPLKRKLPTYINSSFNQRLQSKQDKIKADKMELEKRLLEGKNEMARWKELTKMPCKVKIFAVHCKWALGYSPKHSHLPPLEYFLKHVCSKQFKMINFCPKA